MSTHTAGERDGDVVRVVPGFALVVGGPSDLALTVQRRRASHAPGRHLGSATGVKPAVDA